MNTEQNLKEKLEDEAVSILIDLHMAVGVDQIIAVACRLMYPTPIDDIPKLLYSDKTIGQLIDSKPKTKTFKISPEYLSFFAKNWKLGPQKPKIDHMPLCRSLRLDDYLISYCHDNDCQNLINNKNTLAILNSRSQLIQKIIRAKNSALESLTKDAHLLIKDLIDSKEII